MVPRLTFPDRPFLGFNHFSASTAMGKLGRRAPDETGHSNFAVFPDWVAKERICEIPFSHSSTDTKLSGTRLSKSCVIV